MSFSECARFSSLFVLVHMDVSLWERNADSLLVKTFLDVLGGVAKNDKIVAGVDPRAHHKVHTAIPQFRDRNQRRRILEDSFVLRENVANDLPGLIYIVAVTSELLIY